MCHYFVRMKLASVIISPLVWFTHVRIHPHMGTCVCSPCELLTFSSRLIAIDICLLSWAWSRVGADGNGWCYCRRRKREGRKEVVGRWGGWKEEDRARHAPRAAPERIHLEPPCSPERSRGDSTLHPHYKRAVALTVDDDGASLLRHTTCHPPSPSDGHCERHRAMSSSWKHFDRRVDEGVFVKDGGAAWASVFVLEDGGCNGGGLHLVGGIRHLRAKKKQDTRLLYRGSLLVAERGRAVRMIFK